MQVNSDQPKSLTSPPLLSLRESWQDLSREERVQIFETLPHADADDFFLSLVPAIQSELLLDLPPGERRIWVRVLPLDDLADVIQEAPEDHRHLFLDALDVRTRKEVNALLAYKEDEAGGLMNPHFARLRPEMTVDESIRYLRQQAQKAETTRYVYVLEADQRLVGIVSLRRIFISNGDVIIKDISRTQVITATETMSQEEIADLFSKSGLMAIPVLDEQERMKGIITVDDIVQVVEEEATEDIHRLGGSEVLDDPYLQAGFWQMIRKRAGWLVILFLGEMLTASAMGFYGKQIEQAVVLALFIPLIISSGGNSGSQASTLVVRAIALQEVRLRDWWTIFRRELVVGTCLGGVLGGIGLLKILYWPTSVAQYGDHYVRVGYTVAASLVGIVLWGSLIGSMLPLILKKLGFDPATASAPFVATLVDVFGIIIYFTIASFILKGALL